MSGTFTGYFIAGFVSFAVGVPFLRGWVPRNRLAGFRTPKTLSNDRVWYEANRVAGRDMLIAGLVVMATAVVSALLAQQIPGPTLEKINKLVCIGALLIATLHSFIALRRI
jgi:SdpI/YfhL protein family